MSPWNWANSGVQWGERTSSPASALWDERVHLVTGALLDRSNLFTLSLRVIQPHRAVGAVRECRAVRFLARCFVFLEKKGAGGRASVNDWTTELPGTTRRHACGFLALKAPIGLLYVSPSQLASALTWWRRWQNGAGRAGRLLAGVTSDYPAKAYSSTSDTGYRQPLRAATFRFRPTTPPDCGQRRWTRSAGADRPAQVFQDGSAEQPPSAAVTFVSDGVLQGTAQPTLE